MRTHTPDRDVVAAIDHLVVIGLDLDAAQRDWMRLGFTLGERGFHDGLGTANHVAVLDSSYIELLGVHTPLPKNAMYRQLVQASPGLWGIALRARASDAHAWFSKRGIAATPPEPLSRPIKPGVPEPRARFVLTQIDRAATPGTWCFVCQHETPDLVWGADRPAHANGAVDLVEAVMLVDQHATIARYEHLFGREAERAAGGGSLIRVGDHGIRFLTVEELEERYGTRAVRGIAPPTLVGLVIRVKNIEETARWLEAAAWQPQATAAGGLIVRVPSDGVLVEFS